MSSTISTGMMPVIKFIINGNPLMVNKKETKIDKIELSENLMCDTKENKNYDWVIIDKIRDKSIKTPEFQSLKWNFYKN